MKVPMKVPLEKIPRWITCVKKCRSYKKNSKTYSETRVRALTYNGS
jgi:hypothetical protein